MSTLSLFVNSLLSSPIIKPFGTRYIFIGPQDISRNNIQKVCAIVKDGETSLTIKVDASSSSNLMGGVVLDTTLTLEFMMTNTLQEEPSDTPLKEKTPKKEKLYSRQFFFG